MLRKPGRRLPIESLDRLDRDETYLNLIVYNQLTARTAPSSMSNTAGEIRQPEQPARFAELCRVRRI